MRTVVIALLWKPACQLHIIDVLCPRQGLHRWSSRNCEYFCTVAVLCYMYVSYAARLACGYFLGPDLPADLPARLQAVVLVPSIAHFLGGQLYFHSVKGTAAAAGDTYASPGDAPSCTLKSDSTSQHGLRSQTCTFSKVIDTVFAPSFVCRFNMPGVLEFRRTFSPTRIY